MNKRLLLAFLYISLFYLVLGVSPGHGGGGHHDDHHDHHNDHHEKNKGPNGGELLHEGNITVELALFETRASSQYRAWISRDNEPVDDAQLTVVLTRLDGKQDIFTFSKTGDFWLSNGVVEQPHSFDITAKLEFENQQYHWQLESYDGRITIEPEIAQLAGIASTVVAAGTIERHVQVYGRLVVPPDQKATIHARFPGVITQVNVNVGDIVTTGDLLAVVESNESLKTYQLRAPIDAAIQNRAANTGETTGNDPLFDLVNHNLLWAELKIFPGQRREVKAGQTVYLIHNNIALEGRINSVMSAGQINPFVLARVVIDNRDHRLAPGDLVSAKIAVEHVQTPVVVNKKALQDFRGDKVVFLQVGDTYEYRPVVLGRSDGFFSEVLSGLKPGDRYVLDNSYLIKADIEKAAAAHEH